MTFRTGPVRVATPATSANLGPGFDALGLALTMHDELEGWVCDEGLSVEVTGEGAPRVPLDETHLVVGAMRAAFAAMQVVPPGLGLVCHNVVPHGRGLGSSASAIVGGIVLARSLVEDGGARLDDDGAIALAASLEGHPDNVAAAYLGGLTIAWRHGQVGRAVRLEAAVDLVAFVPPEQMATSQARGLLPEQVPHADAAFNAGRSALLVAALTGRPDLLLDATADRLHQAYRSSAMPCSSELLEILRADGVPAMISGAGPTVLAFVPEGTSPTELTIRCPSGWRAERLGVDPRGSRLVL